jgi:hypothetical protein
MGLSLRSLPTAEDCCSKDKSEAALKYQTQLEGDRYELEYQDW